MEWANIGLLAVPMGCISEVPEITL